MLATALQMGLLQESAAEAAGGFTALLVALAFLVLMIASAWKVFTKAGQPGWASLIPIYNAVVLLQIVKRPLWWIVLLLIPFVNFIVAIVLNNDLAKAFGKGVGMTLLLVFLPFIGWPMLGFGDARYQG